MYKGLIQENIGEITSHAMIILDQDSESADIQGWKIRLGTKTAEQDILKVN